jgi:hypothetical protein
MLQVAFKEWAGVCGAIATGRQALILRKGGVAEVGGRFEPEHARFWLYPTYFHEQQQSGLKAEVDPVRPPPPGSLVLTHLVDVSHVQYVTNVDSLAGLDSEHVWTQDTVRQRFHYRTPGLYVLTVRAYAAEPITVPDRPEYAGCKTWVPLLDPAPARSAVPVLDDDRFAAAAARIRGRLT